MTDRRSLQADAARSSRAFQFVPGHVGGRVASAQPVRRRRTVGQTTALPTPPPSEVSVTSGARTVIGANYVDIAVSDSGPMLAVVLCAAGSLSLPAGWAVAAEGSRPVSWGGGAWAAIYHASPSAGNHRVNTSDPGSYINAVLYQAWQLTASTGGTWAVDSGAVYAEPTFEYITAPAGRVRGQIVLLWGIAGFPNRPPGQPGNPGGGVGLLAWHEESTASEALTEYYYGTGNTPQATGVPYEFTGGPIDGGPGCSTALGWSWT